MLIIRAVRSHNLRSLSSSLSGGIRSRQYSDDKDRKKHDEEKPKKEKDAEHKGEHTKAATSSRLNQLLASMQTDDNNLHLVRKIAIAKPGGKKSPKPAANKKSDKPKDIFEAAKNVADALEKRPEQKRQTESELLSKLLNHIDEASSEKEQKEPKSSAEEMSLNDLIVGMKIDRTEKVKSTPNRAQFVRNAIADRSSQRRDGQFKARGDRNDRKDGKDAKRQQPRKPHPNTGSVNLFGEEPLGIFKDPTVLKDSPDILTTWEYLHKRELKLAVTHPPSNYFEKAALWTEQGKLWQFPINNEAGLDEEAKVDFAEHVFTEQYLEGWCPERGPIRHFMELVCVGLSKNPYITAQEKKDHILWYRDYFEQKKDILKEVISQQAEKKIGAKQVQE